MAGPTTAEPGRPARSPSGRGGCRSQPRKGRRYSLLTRADKVTMALMVGIPTFLCISFIWLPTVASFFLSFTNWRGTSALTARELRRPEELRDSCSRRTRSSGRRVWHNILWLLVVRVHRDADRDLPRGPARPRDARHADLPERVLHPGRPVAGGRRVHLGAQYTSQGFINSILGRTSQDNVIDWLGNPIAQHLGGPGRGQLAPRRLRDGPLPGRAQERRSDPARGGRHRRREPAPDLLPGRLPGHAADQRRDHRHHRHRIAARLRHRVHHQPGQERPRAAVDR